MENVNKKGKLRGKKFVWFERMLRREGRKLCAVALCASMIIGNMAWPAAAANDTSGEYSFELSSESLLDAIQDAIAEGTVVDSELDLKGSAADEYQSFLEAGSSLYEIEPVIDNEDSDRDKVLDLRAFVRLENDIELDSAYVMDGSEEITFLLVNSSDVYQQATISVDGRESETITVLPASAVAVDEEEAGPGVSGTANHSSTTVTGSGSGSGGSGGGGGSSSGAAGSTQIDESAADDDNTADIVIENAEINNDEKEQDSVVEVQPEEGSDEEEQEPEKEDGSAENQQDDADADGTDENVSGTQDETGDVSEEDDKDNDPDGTSDPAVDENTNDAGNTDDNTTDGGSENDPDTADDAGSDSADEDGESGTDKSGNDSTANDQNDGSGEETNDKDGEAGSGETVASAISVHMTYLLAASATSSDAEEATPSDAGSLNGETYETILLDNEAAVAYVTTAEELELDKIETILYTAELDDVVFSVEVPVDALPWGVELKASEYEKDSETYQSRYAETINLIDELDEEEDYTEAIRLFDIGFYDADGVEVEPTEKVNVTITYLDEDAKDIGQIVHFGEEETEVIDVETDYDEDGNKNISYELESFSLVSTIEDRAKDDQGWGNQGYGTTKSFEHIDVRVNGGTFEITQTVTENSTQSITVKKIWDDIDTVSHENDSVTIYLVNENDDIVVDDEGNAYSVELNSEKDWKYTWSGLSLPAGNYGVVENAVTGYKTTTSENVVVAAVGSSSSSATISGSLTLTGIQGSIEITHPNSDGTTTTYTQTISQSTSGSSQSQDGLEYQTGNLSNGVSLYIGDTITVWVNFTLKYTIDGVEYTKDYTDYEYNVVAGEKDENGGNNLCGANGFDFTVSVDELAEDVLNSEIEYNVTITNTPSTVNIPVTKVWDDDGNTYKLRPGNVVVTLYANDVKTESTLILSDSNEWSGTFENLPEYDTSNGASNASRIEYTVQELAVEKYTSKVNYDEDGSITVTNTLNPATVTLTKVVAGNMGVQSEEFEFTVNYTDASGVSQSGTYTLTGESGSNTASFDVKLGTDVTVVETSKDLENSEVQHTISATVNDAKATVSDNTVTFTVNEDSEIVVTNTYSNNPGTGISLDSAPYIGILFGVLLFGAVAFIHRLRRML